MRHALYRESIAFLGAGAAPVCLVNTNEQRS